MRINSKNIRKSFIKLNDNNIRYKNTILIDLIKKIYECYFIKLNKENKTVLTN